MFFSISKQKDNRFLNHQPLGNFYFSHDDGWEINKNSFFKGYRTPNISHGNWTEILLTDNEDIKLSHDDLRSYPLWWNDKNKSLTNLNGDGERIWADENITIKSDNTIEIQKGELLCSVSDTPVKSDDFVDWVISNLSQKLIDFIDIYGNKSLRFFLTGGIDTGTLFALLKYNNKIPNINMLKNEYFYYDEFCNKNISDIQSKHWAYKQLHHWKEKCFLLSGAYGDEFWFRGPYIISLWAAWHDIDIIELLQNHKGYHVGYFLREKNVKIFKDNFKKRHKIKEMYPTFNLLKQQILNINANDHQHWHLNNTITWTPFKDLKIINNILSLPVDDIIGQIVDASLNKKVIEVMAPDVLNIISDTKNINDRKNLTNILL